MSETIVMIHGMSAGPWYWKNYKKVFEDKNYRCVTPTLRFHDRDPNDTPHSQLGATSISDYVNDLEDEIQELGASPILMGHSLGGLLVQILASRGRAKVAVLLAPAPPRGIMVLDSSTLKCFSDVITKWNWWNKPFRLSFDKVAHFLLHLMPEGQQREIYDQMGYESGRALVQMSYLDRSKASRVDHKKVECPVLVVSGREDRVTKASLLKKVAKKYEPLSTYMEFENHAHWVIQEPGWQEIAQSILDWLNEALNRN